MRNDTIRSKLFTRRALMLGAGKLSLLSVLIGRLYYLQIIKSDEYTTLSDSNRIKLSLIPPLRGNIFDSTGHPMATNQTHYRVLLDTEEVDDKVETLASVMNLITIEDEKKQHIIKKILKERARGSILIYDHLSWDDVARIAVHSPDLPGILVEKGQLRYYPYGTLTAHLIGYVGSISEADLAKQPVLNHPDFKIGKNGLEKTLEEELRGQAGIKRIEVDAHGLAVRELSREESTPGNDITLTVNMQLQEFATSKLDPRGSSAVVIDITNGNVIVMASTPSFDANEFTQGISSKYWNELMENPYRPLINKAISSQYPPGSTFKMMVALASLKEGVPPSTIVNCPGYVTLGGRKFHCWKEGGHGSLNMAQALMHSCNSYFYTMARRIGIDNFSNMAKEFGLGAPTSIELPHEASGVVASKSWKRKKYKQEWQMGDTLNSGIGQGYMLATPLQLAVMAARIASGTMVTPHLVMDKEHLHPHFDPMDIPKEHLAVIREGMNAVTNIPGGTAYGSRILQPEFAMAGKTGTSQVIGKKYPGQDNSKSGSWENKNHGLFVGYAPVDNPRYACAVVVEHGGSGSGAAAPVARDILWEVQKFYAAAPSPATTKEPAQNE
jgi:penicillin-binding protein 2